MKTLEEIQKDIEEIDVTKNELRDSSIPEPEKREMIEDLDKILEKLKKEERERMFYGDWSTMRWYPKEEGKYIIRILPKKLNREGSWYLRVHRHYVNLEGYRFKRYVCNKSMFDQRCAICEIARKLHKEGNFKVYARFKFFRQYAMNIVVRGRKEAEGVKIWEAPNSVLNSILIKKDLNSRAIYDYDFIVHYDPEETRNWRRYRVNMRRKESPIGTEEQKQLWLSQMLELTAESLYKPVDDINEPVLLDWAKTCLRTEEHLAWYYSDEGQAEMERGQQEEREKQEKEEKEKTEAKRRNEESRNKWREMIKDGLAAEEFEKESKKDVEGCSTWDILNELFIGEKDWDELRQELKEQLGREEKAKPKK